LLFLHLVPPVSLLSPNRIGAAQPQRKETRKS
jgi:hypothetical protein